MAVFQFYPAADALSAENASTRAQELASHNVAAGALLRSKYPALAAQFQGGIDSWIVYVGPFPNESDARTACEGVIPDMQNVQSGACSIVIAPGPPG